jgi:hypothetical protein
MRINNTTLHTIVRNAIVSADREYRQTSRAMEPLPHVIRLKMERTIWRELCFIASHATLLEIEQTAVEVAKQSVAKWMERRYPTSSVNISTMCTVM